MTSVNLPGESLDRILRRVSAIWGPDAAPHHLIYGQTSSGKTTLIKALLNICPHERALILDPKWHPDPAWDGPTTDPDRWGAPITDVPERFGFEGEPGGGPHGLWFRLIGTPDRPDTGRRFGAALRIVQAEGHCILVLEDVREICRQLGLAGQVDSVMNLGRSANVLAILAATETGYVSGRAQAAMTWIGHTTGLDAYKAGAALLGKSGGAWCDMTGSIDPHQWIYADSQPGNAGPVLVTSPR
jgi:energy-coupling factor transporter ATP-binding protein EcfA2